MSDDYLFDPKAPADPEVQKLEQALARFRRSGDPAPIAPLLQRRRQRLVHLVTALTLAAAAALLVTLDLGLFKDERDLAPSDVALQDVEGSVRVNDAAHAAPSVGADDERPLRPGDRVVCDAGGRARVKVGDIGWLTLEENTRLRVAEGREEEDGAYRLDLERGTVSALIFAAPRLFWLGTPSGIAVDLGCVYKTTVDDEGHATLAVTRGRVSFESDGRRVYVPAGAFCRAWPAFGPGTPAWEDASEALRSAVIRHDEARMRGDAEAARRAIEEILETDAARDSLTLWHLLDPRGDPEPELRAKILEKLLTLCPPPDDAPRDKVLAGDKSALTSWREKIETECW
jgi:hypothetical protein